MLPRGQMYTCAYPFRGLVVSFALPRSDLSLLPKFLRWLVAGLNAQIPKRVCDPLQKP